MISVPGSMGYHHPDSAFKGKIELKNVCFYHQARDSSAAVQGPTTSDVMKEEKEVKRGDSRSEIIMTNPLFAAAEEKEEEEHPLLVLNGVDLQLHPGTVTALVGPSGSGKSTIAYLIERFYDITR